MNKNQPNDYQYYSAQTNKHGNVIVCKGVRQRNTYKVIKEGSYDACNQCKAWPRNRRIQAYEEN